MKDKLIYIGIVILVINLILTLSVVFDKKDVGPFAGVTNLDALELSETLSVTGASTLTGATTASGNLNADGGLIVGGRKNYGEKASFSLSASDICDYSIIAITAHTGDGDDDEVGVSLSFPDDETLQADCLGTAGDYKMFYIDNTSSISTHYIDFTTTGMLIETASTSLESDISGAYMVKTEVFNTGTSLSWLFSPFYASVSYQPND